MDINELPELIDSMYKKCKLIEITEMLDNLYKEFKLYISDLSIMNESEMNKIYEYVDKIRELERLRGYISGVEETTDKSLIHKPLLQQISNSLQNIAKSIGDIARYRSLK